MSPCVRVSSSDATSTRVVKPSANVIGGRAVAGAAAAAGGGADGFIWQLPIGTSKATARQRVSLLMFELQHLFLAVARDEIVFFCVVAKRAERHAQQLGGLRLDAAAALQCLQHEDLADRFEVIGQRDAVGRQL